MRRARGLRALIVYTIIAVGLFTLTFVKDWKPLLGLDLQGGVSVVLVPTTDFTEETLNQAIAIMNQRINSLGVAEPEITRQGNNILVQIPGVKDKERAIALVGKTAELRFRPALAVLPPDNATGETTGTVPPGSVPGTVPGVVDPAAGSPTTSAAVTPAPADGASTTLPAATPQRFGTGEGESAAGLQDPTTAPPSTVTDAPVTTVAVDPAAVPTTAVDPNAPPTTLDPALQAQIDQQLQQQALSQTGDQQTTPPEQDTRDNPQVVLPEYDPTTGEQVQRFVLGPVALTGEALQSATAVIDPNTGQWLVRPVFKPGAEGIDQFNAIAAKCYSKAPECPTGRLAITLDARVISAPNIQAASFQRDQIQISGSFTEESAKDLATGLNYGALPVQLEQQSSQIVSATIGEDALRAGLVAGAVGLALVAVYMIVFYRILGALSLVKLVIEGMLLWFVIAYLGETAGLALTLAGVTGIIVSIGVSLDSNVVYYEHLREDIRNGRTVRSAVDKSFDSAWGTILKADGASVLGAALLYWLAVGPVRGFAFYLGLSTLLDLLSSFFYLRPVVGLATSSKAAHRRPALFGLPLSVGDEDEGAIPARPSRRRGGADRPNDPTPTGAK